MIRRWALAGDPHGVAIGADGTIYVGLAQPQAVVAIDPKTGTVKKKLVLDSAEIASTKELVTLRTNANRSLLFIANGSDESATILSLPELAVVREITMEGEPIRDAMPDPRGRFVYLLGRHVHVFDRRGETELHTLDIDDPTAMAVSNDGRTLAVVGRDVVEYETNDFREIKRVHIKATPHVALFANDDLVLMGRDSLIDIASRTATHICLPDGSGPQIATLASNDLLLFAEQPCNVPFVPRRAAFDPPGRAEVSPTSLYGVKAYAVAYDGTANALVTTDRGGYLTIFKVPRAPVVH